MTEQTGIYVHIPFCKSKCSYCDFYSIPTSDERLMDEYLGALIKQIGDYSLGGAKYPADTVYIGGGTPSYFGGKRISVLLKEIRKRFSVSETAEITVEVNPESCSEKFFKILKKSGVNRVSVGVQSSDDKELSELSRVHDFAEAQKAVNDCRKYCTDNISVDLMFGLPGQTLESLERSLEDILSLEPKHISCYALTPYEGTPLYENRRFLPDDDLVADMYLYLVEKLNGRGFIQYEISNFAKKEYKSKHNSKYWELKPYIGLGAAAHSFFGNKRFSCVKNVEKYIEKIAANEPVIDVADEIADANRVGEYIMLRLRTADGINESDFYKRFDRDFIPYAGRLEKYVKSGHAVHEGENYRLTPKGFFISNTIIADVLD
ncbi:MAG: radical SAM family heme chaperone HemW [Clostridia bacterium]|nr:radical SAM family heme chaperone HemW [Clostridia bacterium]